jgi:hypothetical protein
LSRPIGRLTVTRSVFADDFVGHQAAGGNGHRHRHQREARDPFDRGGFAHDFCHELTGCCVDPEARNQQGIVDLGLVVDGEVSLRRERRAERGPRAFLH